jgi:hypothetical protein
MFIVYLLDFRWCKCNLSGERMLRFQPGFAREEIHSAFIGVDKQIIYPDVLSNLLKFR